MESAQLQALCEPPLAAMPQLKEKLRLGVTGKTPALHPGHNVPNSTAALGVSWSVASGTRQSDMMGRFLSPDWSAKEEPVPYAKLDDPQSLNLYSYVRNNPLSKTDPDGHGVIDIFALAQGITSGVQDFARNHPMATGIAKGVGNATLGVGTVVVSLGGEAASGGLSTAISAIGVGAGTSLFVKGVTQAVGAPTNTDVQEATKALDATRNPAGLVTTAVTGGNMEAGDKAATALDVVTAASDVKELATQGMNGELKINAATGTKLTNLALTAHDAQNALKPPQEQKKPDQK